MNFCLTNHQNSGTQIHFILRLTQITVYILNVFKHTKFELFVCFFYEYTQFGVQKDYVQNASSNQTKLKQKNICFVLGLIKK